MWYMLGNVEFCLRCVVFFILSLSCSPLWGVANWSAPVDLSEELKDAIMPHVAVGADGKCYAAWSRYDGSSFIIQSASAAKLAGAWSLASSLSLPIGNSHFNQISIIQKTNPIVVWAQKINGKYEIQSAQMAQDVWTAPLTLSTDPTSGHNAIKPQIATNQNGQDIVVWEQFNGITNVIEVVGKKYNNPWSLPCILSDESHEGFGAIDPQVAIDSKGLAIVTWIDTATQTVQASMLGQNGHWTSPLILSEAGASIRSPQVVMDDQGNKTVVWSRFDGTARIIQATSISSTGQWSGPVNISAPGQDANNAKIVLDSGGNVTVVWQRYDGVNTIVQASTKQNGPVQNWSTPVDLSSAGEDASDPQICVNSAQQLAVIWKRSDGSNFIIQSTIKFPGNDWELPVSLSAVGQDATQPQLAIDKCGNIVAVWIRGDGQNLIVQASFAKTKK